MTPRSLGLVLLLFVACHSAPEDPHAQVRATAEQAYRALAEGNADDYLALTQGYEASPEELRAQLRAAMETFIERERKAHGGYMSVSAVADTLLDSVNARAFIEITYADSVQERVSVPLQRTEGRWLLK